MFNRQFGFNLSSGNYYLLLFLCRDQIQVSPHPPPTLSITMKKYVIFYPGLSPLTHNPVSQGDQSGTGDVHMCEREVRNHLTLPTPSLHIPHLTGASSTCTGEAVSRTQGTLSGEEAACCFFNLIGQEYWWGVTSVRLLRPLPMVPIGTGYV